MTDAVILNGTVTRCTLDILTGHHSLERAIPRCHYASVCPTPCNTEQRVIMIMDEVKHDRQP